MGRGFGDCDCRWWELSLIVFYDMGMGMGVGGWEDGRGR